MFLGSFDESQSELNKHELFVIIIVVIISISVDFCVCGLLS